jgi:hypothetical protein
VKWIVCAILLLLLAGALMPFGRTPPQPQLVTRMNLKNLDAAMAAFWNDFGRVPSGGVSRIAAVLSGNDTNQNSRGVMYIEVTPISRTFTGRIRGGTVNEAGQYLDGWFRPVQVRTTPEGWTIVSAGPDGVPNSADDIEVTRTLKKGESRMSIGGQ